MGFTANILDRPPPVNHLTFGNKCFGYGNTVEKAAVFYDGFALGALLFHSKCANEVGQRLIMDSWPNRRHDPRFEKNVS